MVGLLDAITEKMSQSVVTFSGQAADAVMAALVIIFFFLIGYVIAWIVAKIIETAMKELKVEHRLTGGKKLEIAGFSLTHIIVVLVKIFVVLTFLGAATQLVSLWLITDVIRWALIYVPSLIEGIVVIIAALLFGDYLTRIIRQTREIPVTDLTALVVQLFVAYIALVLALPMILPGVNVAILEQAFVWFVTAAAIAIGVGAGIAIGFGLRVPIEQAAKKHPRLFDYFFGEFEKGFVSEGKKKR